MLTIVDYGLGNNVSVLNMIHRVGGQAKISDKQDDILNASKLILPGVGSFDHGVEQLHARELFSVIQQAVEQGTPILGICLGMQLLAKRSDEGEREGFGFINAEFKRFSFVDNHVLKIPHVGWSHIEVKRDNPFFNISSEKERFYFTHSYHAVDVKESEIIAVVDYGYYFPVVYGRNNILGVQFHPEKSHRFGMAFFKRFLEFSC